MQANKRRIMTRTNVLPSGLQKLIGVIGLNPIAIKRNQIALTIGGEELRLHTDTEYLDYKRTSEKIITGLSEPYRKDSEGFVVPDGQTQAIRVYKLIN